MYSSCHKEIKLAGLTKATYALIHFGRRAASRPDAAWVFTAPLKGNRKSKEEQAMYVFLGKEAEQAETHPNVPYPGISFSGTGENREEQVMYLFLRRVAEKVETRPNFPHAEKSFFF